MTTSVIQEGPVSQRVAKSPERLQASDEIDPLERFESRLQQRYGAAAFEVEARLGGRNALRTLESLLSHRSVRRYSDQPLEPGTLELLIAAAQSAASSSNLQLWSVVNVEDPDLRQALSLVAGDQAHVRKAPLFLVWVADLHRASELARLRGLADEGLDYLESFLVASVDAALAAQNAVAAAEALGLGTVYIGALRNHPERVAQLLGLPPRAYAVFGLCVGWPDPAQPAAVKPRLPQGVVLHRDRYRFAALEQAQVGGYDQLMKRFYESEQLPVPEGGWSLHTARRFATAAALNGRHVLRETLGRLGFQLK
jgi:nitroreductase